MTGASMAAFRRGRSAHGSQSTRVRRCFVAVLFVATWAHCAAQEIPADWRDVIHGISADSLRGHISFLASDLLEGRDTPSRGLDIAAEYIAAQFRRAGLEPAGDDGYFQTADMVERTPSREGIELTIHAADRIVRAATNDVAAQCSERLSLDRAPLVKTGPGDINRLEAEEAAGAVLVVEAGLRFEGERRLLLKTAREKGAALVLLLAPGRRNPLSAVRPELMDPEEPRAESVPTMVVADPGVAELLRGKRKSDPVTVSARCRPEREEPVRLRNVVGLLRGSDPALRDTVVIVSAHYDHLGLRYTGEDDTIFNGANDNASGAAGVIETASALSRAGRKPRRSILFVAFFGEERGLLGSRYYARHPVVPLEATVADVNLEQLGRRDADGETWTARAALTGFGYSSVTTSLEEAARLTGMKLYQHPWNSDAFFTQSDNIGLAAQGVPAHTVSVGYMFEDYHRPGDEWEKLDYDNIRRVVQMVALGALLIGNAEEAPQWNEAEPKADAYREARRD